MTDIQIYRIYIDAPAQRVWDAIVSTEYTTKYGYAAALDIDLSPGGSMRQRASEEMRQMGMPEVVINGEVITAEAPRRLVHTWSPVWLDEPATTLTWELEQFEGGPTLLTLTHDVTDAPETARQVDGGADPGTGGGGWPWVLDSMKTLLETDRMMTGIR